MSSPAGSAGSSARPTGSRPGTSTSRSSTRAATSWASSRERSSACASGCRGLDHARREFIANASHELRTPIFSLGGHLELLDDEELDEDDAARVRRRDARAGRPPRQADRESCSTSRASTPGACASSRSRSTSSRRSRLVAAELAPLAQASGHVLEADAERLGVGARRRASACSRSHARSSRTRCGTRPQGPRSRSAPSRAATRVELVVEDDGPGIPAEHRAARVRALLPGRRRDGVRQRPRAGDRPRAGRADGRHAGARRSSTAGRASRSRLPAAQRVST